MAAPGRSEVLGGMALIGATLLALVVANSAWAVAYDAALSAEFGLLVLHWINAPRARWRWG